MVGTRDIAAVTVAYLLDGGYNGQTYLITGGQAVSYARIAEKFSAVLGGKVQYVDLPS